MQNRVYQKLALSFFYLLIVGLMGAYLRFMFIFDPEIFNYQYLLHSHSHTAILGWVYNALFIAVLLAFLPEQINSKKYNVIFWLTQFAVIGMTISFAVQGYASVSISFSTLHILMSYVFIYCFVIDTRKNNKTNRLISLKFVYGGIFFLFLSSFGPWGLAVIVANGLSGSDLYKQAIYFYLHFQYNGWFIFALIGLWLSQFEKSFDDSTMKSLNLSFLILFVSNLPAYFLSLLGFKVGIIIWLIALLSAAAQLTGYLKLFSIANSFNNERLVNSKRSWVSKLYKLSIICLLFKFILQLFSALPSAGDAAFISREVTIAFIHLVMLGVVTPGLIGWYGSNKIIELDKKLISNALILYSAGFIISEVFLFYPSLVIWFRFPAIPYYGIILFVITVMILISVIFIFYSYIKRFPIRNS